VRSAGLELGKQPIRLIFIVALRKISRYRIAGVAGIPEKFRSQMREWS
jgi:hypothetical protein